MLMDLDNADSADNADKPYNADRTANLYNTENLDKNSTMWTFSYHEAFLSIKPVFEYSLSLIKLRSFFE